MSKNFEEEYKALVSEELPDLWNRIEDGLTPKTTALSEETGKNRPAEEEGKSESGKEQGRNKGKVLSFLYKYRTVAAAALCVVIVIPAVIVLGKMGRTKEWEGLDEMPEINMSAAQNQDGQATAEVTDRCAVEEFAAEAAEEESVDTTMESTAADMAEYAVAEADSESGAVSRGSADSGAGSSSAGSSVRDMGETASADEASAMPADAEKKLNNNQQLSDSMAEAAAEEKQEEKMKVYENITVEVTEITEETTEAEKNIFYGMKVKVVKDPAGELAEGKEITVWVSYSSSMAYLEGETYTLKLSYDPDRECPYQVS